MPEYSAFSIGKIVLPVEVDLRQYNRDRTRLINDANRLSVEVGRRMSYGISTSLAGLEKDVEGYVYKGGERAFTRLQRLLGKSTILPTSGLRGQQPPILGASFRPSPQFNKQSRQAGRTAGQEISQGVTEGIRQAEPIVSTQFNKSITRAILVSDFIRYGLKRGVTAALGSLPGQISQVIGNTLSGGSNLNELINIQLETNTTASTFSSLSGLGIAEASKQVEELNSRLAISAAALPGNTASYARLSRQIGDSLVPAFKEANGAFDASGYNDTLASISESFGAVTATTTRDIGNTSLALTRFLNGATVAELRNLSLFEQNPVALNKIEEQLQSIGASSLREITLDARIRLLDSIGSQLVTEDFKKLSEESVDGLLQSFRSSLFDPTTGILGLNRDLDKSLEGTQSVFTSFNEVLRGLIGQSSDDMGLLFRIAESAQKAGLNIGSPLANQKNILDRIGQTIEQLKGNTDALFQSNFAQGLIAGYNGVSSVLQSIVSDSGSLKLAITGAATVLGGPLGGAFALVATNADRVAPAITSITSALGKLALAAMPIVTQVQDVFFDLAEGVIPYVTSAIAALGNMFGTVAGQAQPLLAGISSIASTLPDRTVRSEPQSQQQREQPSLGGVLSSGLDSGQEFAASAVERVKEAATGAQPIVSNLLEMLGGALSTIGSIGNLIIGLAPSFQPVLLAVTNVASGLTSGIAAGVGAFAKQVRENAPAIASAFTTVAKVTEALKPGLISLGKLIGVAAGKALVFVSNILGNEKVRGFLVGVSTTISSIITKVTDFIENNPIVGKVAAIAAGIVGIVKVVGALSAAWAVVGGLLLKGALVVSSIAAAWGTVSGAVAVVGGAIAGVAAFLSGPIVLTVAAIAAGVTGIVLLVRKFMPQIKNIIGGLKDWAGTLKTKVSEGFSSAKEKLGGILGNIREGATKLTDWLGITDELSAGFENMKAIAGGIKDQFFETLGTLESVGKKVSEIFDRFKRERRQSADSSAGPSDFNNGVLANGGGTANGATTINVVRTGQKDSEGLEILRMDLVETSTGRVVDSVLGNSGVASTQNFTASTARNATPGSLAPIPTGTFDIAPTASSDDPGVDGWFVPLTGSGDNEQGRGAFGIHMDANRVTSPGSAGCLVLYDPAAKERVQRWLEDKNAPRELTVSYSPGPAGGVNVSRGRGPISLPSGASNAPDTYRPRGGTVGTAERVQNDVAGATAIVEAAERLNLDPYEFTALMSWESAGTLNPNVLGGDGNAYQGLIQFSPSNQADYGITDNMTIAEFMPAVEKYLLDRGFDPQSPDIRSAYSAILAGNASERYWNAADSNGTTVRNASGKFTSGDHYDRAVQFLSDSLGSAVDEVQRSTSLPDTRYDKPAEAPTDPSELEAWQQRVADATASGIESGVEASDISVPALNEADILASERARKALEDAQNRLRRAGQLRQQERQVEDREIGDERRLRQAESQAAISELDREDIVGRRLLEYEQRGLEIDEAMSDRLRTNNRQVEDLEDARELKLRQIERLETAREAFELDPVNSGVANEEELKKLEAEISPIDYSQAIAEFRAEGDRLEAIRSAQITTERNKILDLLDTEIEKTEQAVLAADALAQRYSDPSAADKYRDQIGQIERAYDDQTEALERQIDSLDKLIELENLSEEQQVDLVRQRVAAAQALDRATDSQERAIAVAERNYRRQQEDRVAAQVADIANRRIEVNESEATSIERFAPNTAASIRRQGAETRLSLQTAQEIRELMRVEEELIDAIESGNQEYIASQAEIGLGTTEAIQQTYAELRQGALELAEDQAAIIAEQFPTVAGQFRLTVRDSFNGGLEEGLNDVFFNNGDFLSNIGQIFVGIGQDILKGGIKQLSDSITGSLFGNGDRKGLLDGLFGSNESTIPDQGQQAADLLQQGGLLAGREIVRAAEQASLLMANASGGAGFGGAGLAGIGSVFSDRTGRPGLNGLFGSSQDKTPPKETYREAGLIQGRAFAEQMPNAGRGLGDIFTRVLGGISGGSSGGGFWGSVLNIVGSIFYGGGRPGVDGEPIPNFANGSRIEKAMNKERVMSGGATPMLAVVNDTEFIIQGSGTQRLRQQYGDDFLHKLNEGVVDIPNYAIGGFADSIQPAPSFARSIGAGPQSGRNRVVIPSQSQRPSVNIKYQEISGKRFVPIDEVNTALEDLQSQIDTKSSASEAAETVFELMREFPEVRDQLGLN